MPRPRQVLANQFYMITRRCAQRSFLLRPDAATTNAFWYCLALAANVCGIEIIGTCAMSNHHHTIIFDRFGVYPLFIERFHKLFARSQNVLRQRAENFWATGQCSVVRLLDREAVIEKLVYCLTNPVKGGLVDRVHHWPGASSWKSMRMQVPVVAQRPRHFFRSNGPTPATVTLDITIPEVLGTRADVIREVEQRASVIEEQCAAARKLTGAGVIGRRRLLAQSWNDSPETNEERSMLSPRIATRNATTRIAAIRELREFLAAYRTARSNWLEGRPAWFPPGTYLLKRFSIAASA